jgi:hypothetical protein
MPTTASSGKNILQLRQNLFRKSRDHLVPSCSLHSEALGRMSDRAALVGNFKNPSEISLPRKATLERTRMLATTTTNSSSSLARSWQNCALLNAARADSRRWEAKCCRVAALAFGGDGKQSQGGGGGGR